MAVRLRVYLDIDWVGDGMGPSGLYIAAANNPMLGSVGNAQTLRLQQGEPVQAVLPDTPTATEIHDAVLLAAADLNVQIDATVVAQIDGWATGNP
jgi:hypothetical protein